jgi:hypothetical protein
LATMDGLFMFFRTAFPMPFPFPHLAEFIVIDAVLARFILVSFFYFGSWLKRRSQNNVEIERAR